MPNLTLNPKVLEARMRGPSPCQSNSNTPNWSRILNPKPKLLRISYNAAISACGAAAEWKLALSLLRSLDHVELVGVGTGPVCNVGASVRFINKGIHDASR